MTPKGTTGGKGDQRGHFRQVIVRIHMGKSSLVRYSIKLRQQGLRLRVGRQGVRKGGGMQTKRAVWVVW